MSLLFSILNDPLQEFRILVYILSAVGLIILTLYLIFCPEVPLTKLSKECDLVYRDQVQKAIGEDIVMNR